MLSDGFLVSEIKKCQTIKPGGEAEDPQRTDKEMADETNALSLFSFIRVCIQYIVYFVFS